MNNYILVNITYATTSPESLDSGEFEETGFERENEKFSFRELVTLMKEHTEPSSSGNVTENTWFSTDFYTVNFRDGINKQTSIHFSKHNTKNGLKYWKLARKFALKNRNH